MLTKEDLDKGFNLGGWQVLPAKGLLRRGEEELHPEPRVFDVLLSLARRDGNLVTKDELIAEVWDGKAFSDEPLLRCISLLRGHFGDKRPYEYIETLQRRGYRLLKPVELHGAGADMSEPDRPRPRARRWGLIAALVAVFVVIASYSWLRQYREPEPLSLAILQVENLTGDPGRDYIVDGVKNLLARRLAGIPGFTVKNVLLDYDDEMPAIAARHNVEFLLTGDVQLEDGTLKVSYLITRGADGATTGGGEVSGLEQSLFDLQERLARAVRDDIAGPDTPQLVTRRKPDSAAYNSYMRGMFALELRFDGNNLATAIELFEESIRLDENYGPAYLALATAYSLTHDYYGEPFDEMRELALETIGRGVSVDPGIEDAFRAVHGRIFHQEKDWARSEAAYLRAINASVVDSNAFSWYSRMLASTGRLEAARDIVLVAEDLDPDNPMVNSRIAMAQTWLGDDAEAYTYFKRSNALGATGNLHIMTNALLLYRDGKADESRELSLAASRITNSPGDWIEPVYAALADAGKRAAALAAIDRAWEEQKIIPDIVLIVRTLLGDLDGAMEIAELLEGEGEAFSIELVFIPELAPLRGHPGFLPLLERLGIVGYWKELGCTWDGDRVRCPATRLEFSDASS